MSFHRPQVLVKNSDLLTEVSDPDVLRTHPKMRASVDAFMEHVHDLRQIYDDEGITTNFGKKAGRWKQGTGFHVARIPENVWGEHIRRDPHLLHDKAKIYQMLQPGGAFGRYRVGGFKLVG